MILFSAILGTVLPLIVGWLGVCILDKKQVLGMPEKIAISYLGGSILSMFVVFLLNISVGLPLSWWGYGVVYLVLIGPLALINKQPLRRPRHLRIPRTPLTILLTLWIGLKILPASISLLGTPVYYDDVFGNWNMRARVFSETQTIAHALPLGNGAIDSISLTSYPPMVPLLKSSYSAFAGAFVEGLVNIPHILWYLCILLLLYGFVVRRLSPIWGLIAIYIFTALPLPLVHASAAYADLLVAALLLAIVGLLSRSKEHPSLLTISSVLTSLLVFTKNEAILLYVPILVVISILLSVSQPSSVSRLRAISYQLTAISFITLPWLLYKWFHGLPFGNAKTISDLEILWQPEVLRVFAINTFLEGNWNLLPLLFVCLVILNIKKLRQVHILIPLLFVLFALSEQLGIFVFTGLSAEAMKQTGLARGILQLIPIVVLISVLLMDQSKKLSAVS